MPAQLIKQYALQLGFDACGIARAEALEAEEFFVTQWLQKGYHAEMGYMAKNRKKRVDPRRLMEGAKSVICLLANYKPAQWQGGEFPQIAAFAYGADYHTVLKERLHRLKAYISSIRTDMGSRHTDTDNRHTDTDNRHTDTDNRHTDTDNRHTDTDNVRANANSRHTPVRMRLFVDTAPILERAWAARAGLGWIGKSALLVSPHFGPFTFIAIILTDLELEYDNPLAAQCGSCTRCLQACPTGALCAPYTVDARRCIAYHTIENKAPCSVDPQPYLFGCDSCIRACPWGDSAPATSLFPPLPNTLQLTAKAWETLSLNDYHHRFAGSPLQRAGLSKLQNTLKYGMANKSNPYPSAQSF